MSILYYNHGIKLDTYFILYSIVSVVLYSRFPCGMKRIIKNKAKWLVWYLVFFFSFILWIQIWILIVVSYSQNSYLQDFVCMWFFLFFIKCKTKQNLITKHKKHNLQKHKFFSFFCRKCQLKFIYSIDILLYKNNFFFYTYII